MEQAAAGPAAGVAPYSISEEAECQQEAQQCWICLGEEEDEALGALQRPCKCVTRPCHPKCLARWQLQQAGRVEEERCRFCDQKLPDWRHALAPPSVKPVTPVMAIKFEGKTYKLRVQPGPEGLATFKAQVRQLLGLDISEEFDVSFECQVPTTGEKVKLMGLGSYGAATTCAAITAGEREILKPSSKPTDHLAGSMTGTDSAQSGVGAGAGAGPFVASSSRGSRSSPHLPQTALSAAQQLQQSRSVLRAAAAARRHSVDCPVHPLMVSLPFAETPGMQGYRHGLPASSSRSSRDMGAPSTSSSLSPSPFASERLPSALPAPHPLLRAPRTPHVTAAGAAQARPYARATSQDALSAPPGMYDSAAARQAMLQLHLQQHQQQVAGGAGTSTSGGGSSSGHGSSSARWAITRLRLGSSGRESPCLVQPPSCTSCTSQSQEGLVVGRLEPMLHRGCPSRACSFSSSSPASAAYAGQGGFPSMGSTSGLTTGAEPQTLLLPSPTRGFQQQPKPHMHHVLPQQAQQLQAYVQQQQHAYAQQQQVNGHQGHGAQGVQLMRVLVPRPSNTSSSAVCSSRPTSPPCTTEHAAVQLPPVPMQRASTPSPMAMQNCSPRWLASASYTGPRAQEMEAAVGSSSGKAGSLPALGRMAKMAVARWLSNLKAKAKA